MASHGSTGEITKISGIEAEELLIQWQITGRLVCDHFDNYTSPDFTFGDELWWFRLWPYYADETQDPPSRCVRLAVIRQDRGPPKTFHISVGISGFWEVELQEVEKEFSVNDEYYSADFCSNSELNKHEIRLWPNDTMKIACELRRVVPIADRSVFSEDENDDWMFRNFEPQYYDEDDDDLSGENKSSEDENESDDDKDDGKVPEGEKNTNHQNQVKNTKKTGSIKDHYGSEMYRSIETQDEEDDDYFSVKTESSEDGDESEEDIDDGKVPKIKKNVKQQNQLKNAKKRIETLLKDFEKLLSSSENSDVTVQVGEVQFEVHRAILSVRSPVLCAMFRHETEERTSNRISVCDFEPEVFKQYLHYIYTGSVETLSEQNAFGLYRIADKYLADDLKEQCLEHIRGMLCVQTFCDTVKLALTHGESDLLHLAIDFATQNVPSIIRSAEWQNFIREFPTEANEILIKCIKPGS